MTQPTYDEVIAWIDEQIELDDLTTSRYPSVDLQIIIQHRAFLLANRAGLERHKPDESFDEPRIVSPCCKECSQEYENGNYIFHPCPTYTDIYNPIAKVM